MSMDARERTGSGFDARKVGVAAAIVIAVGVVGVFTLLALRAQTPAGGQERTGPAAVDLPPEALTDAGNAQSVMEAPVESLRGSDEGLIELFDEETGELTRTLAYSRFEPLEAGRYSVTDPRARIILDDGRAIEITSRVANFTRRGQSNEPQSGAFNGDVRIRLLESSGEDAVGMTIATDSLRFDSTLGELRTTDPVVATSADTEFKGEGLTAVYSEADRTLLYMRIDKGESFTWTPTDAPAADLPREQNASASATKPGAGETTHYRAVFTGPLTIESGPRTVEAERLELWATLLDGGLSRDAITRVRFASGAEDQPADADAGASDLLGGGGEPVVMRWSGPLEIQPVKTMPPELIRDKVFVRMSSPNQGLVRVRDKNAGAEASGVAFEYGLTSGAFTVTGVGPRGVTLRADNRAEALVGRFEANLVAGKGAFPGPGTLRALRDELLDAPLDSMGQPLPRDVSWSGRADFTLAKNDAGDLLGALDSAVFNDAVLARDAGREASAALAELGFARANGSSELRSVSLRDRASLDAGEEGRVNAERIDLAFVEGASGDPLLRTATAEGGVRAVQRDATIRAELVEIGFVPDDRGRPEADSFRAELGVEIAIGTGDERIEAVADTVRASPRAESAELIGEPAVLRRGPATLRGRALRLDGSRDSIEAFGPGQADYLLAAAPGGRDDSLPYESVRATWESAMSYDDSTGRAEFVGEATLEGDSGALVRDTARSERIVALFERVEGASPAEGNDLPVGDRRLVHAEFLSARYEGVSESNAEIESRRYRAAEGGGVALTQLLFLEGERVIVDGPSRGLEVPGAGRLVVEDRRENGEKAPSDGSLAAGGGDSRGTTMFEWDGALRASRAAGDATITNGVLVRHLPLDGTQTVELEAERVSAIMPEGEGSPTAAEQVKVQRVEASGAVYVRSGRRQMIADRLIYAPVDRTIEAYPALGNVVTLFDPQVGSPLIARKPVYWNIATDTLNASGLEPIAAPR